jgi:hypothetical protein
VQAQTKLVLRREVGVDVEKLADIRVDEPALNQIGQTPNVALSASDVLLRDQRLMPRNDLEVKEGP